MTVPEAQAKQTLETVDALLKQCYGDWTAAGGEFPRPMAEREAGPSTLCGQRRYLCGFLAGFGQNTRPMTRRSGTDAFAILTFISQSQLSLQLYRASNAPNAHSEGYLGAASRLIDAVHECLGNPRSPRFKMEPDEERGGYRGLRIGKLHAVADGTDYGMTYDGMVGPRRVSARTIRLGR
jgi:hypothetical protein